MTTIGRDQHSNQHIYIYNVFNFFPGPYLVNETSRERQVSTLSEPISTKAW